MDVGVVGEVNVGACGFSAGAVLVVKFLWVDVLNVPVMVDWLDGT